MTNPKNTEWDKASTIVDDEDDEIELSGSSTIMDDEDEDDGTEFVDCKTPISRGQYTWSENEHPDWDNMDISERLMTDPSYIDRL